MRHQLLRELAPSRSLADREGREGREALEGGVRECEFGRVAGEVRLRALSATHRAQAAARRVHAEDEAPALSAREGRGRARQQVRAARRSLCGRVARRPAERCRCRRGRLQEQRHRLDRHQP